MVEEDRAVKFLGIELRRDKAIRGQLVPVSRKPESKLSRSLTREVNVNSFLGFFWLKGGACSLYSTSCHRYLFALDTHGSPLCSLTISNSADMPVDACFRP